MSGQEKALHLPPGAAALRLQGLPDHPGGQAKLPVESVAEPSSAQAWKLSLGLSHSE